MTTLAKTTRTAPVRRTAETIRNWKARRHLEPGLPAVFLGAALWAVLAIGVWPFVFSGDVELPTAFSPIDWHAHEMIFGYVAAVVAGFLMTAIPNWTGRLPVSGWPLIGLTALWAAGRLAMFEFARLGDPLSALADCAFLVVFAAMVAREVIAGRNWRNAKVVALVAILAIANIAYHWRTPASASLPIAQRAALALIVMLILLVGGRVTPSFTSSWLGRQGASKPPAPFAKPDATVMLVSGLALAAWVAAPDAAWTAPLSLAAGLGNSGGSRAGAGSPPAAMCWCSCFTSASGSPRPDFCSLPAMPSRPLRVPFDASVHVWAIGGAGAMTLAMMTRASLGHSGRALVATTATKAAYALIVVALRRASCARVSSPPSRSALLHMAATAWVAAFASFLLGYAPLLARRQSLRK